MKAWQTILASHAIAAEKIVPGHLVLTAHSDNQDAICNQEILVALQPVQLTITQMTQLETVVAVTPTAKSAAVTLLMIDRYAGRPMRCSPMVLHVTPIVLRHIGKMKLPNYVKTVMLHATLVMVRMLITDILVALITFYSQT